MTDDNKSDEDTGRNISSEKSSDRSDAAKKVWWWMVISEPSGVVTTTLLNQGGHLIGRGSSCNIIVRDETVSKTHCNLILFPDPRRRPVLQNFEPRNHTLIDGKRIKKKRNGGVPEGGVITIGSTIIRIIQLTKEQQ